MTLIRHPFERDPLGWPTCIHVRVVDGTGRVCDRPEAEHAQVPEPAEEKGGS